MFCSTFVATSPQKVTDCHPTNGYIHGGDTANKQLCPEARGEYLSLEYTQNVLVSKCSGKCPCSEYTVCTSLAGCWTNCSVSQYK